MPEAVGVTPVCVLRGPARTDYVGVLLPCRPYTSQKCTDMQSLAKCLDIHEDPMQLFAAIVQGIT